MVADPFSGTISMRNMVTGEVQHEPFTVSDVAAAYFIFTKTNNNFTRAPGDAKQQCFITDISLTENGEDCNRAQLLISQKDTGIVLLYDSLQAAVNNRIPQPIPVSGGSTIQIKQLAI